MYFGQPFGGLLPGARGAVLSVLLRTDAPITGRQVHSLVSDDFSLWSVQEALKTLAQLGIIETQTIGRAGVHTVNDDHFAVAHLRALSDPLAALRSVIAEHVNDSVEAVVVFGSVARGEATETSDVDLAVIGASNWQGKTDLEDAVRSRLGNDCDVLVFTTEQFTKSTEPVVADILNEGVALVGSMPRAKAGVA